MHGMEERSLVKHTTIQVETRKQNLQIHHEITFTFAGSRGSDFDVTVTDPSTSDYLHGIRSQNHTQVVHQFLWIIKDR